MIFGGLVGAILWNLLTWLVGLPSSSSHALIGGLTAAVLWELTRHVLVWYFATLSQVTIVYGSLTTAIVVLLSLEIAATLLLFWQIRTGPAAQMMSVVGAIAIVWIVAPIADASNKPIVRTLGLMLVVLTGLGARLRSDRA